MTILSSILNWDMKHLQMCEMWAAGTKAIGGWSFDDDVAAIDNGDGTVSLKLTAHGMVVGSHIMIAGTTNYDGCHIIAAADPEADSNHFSIGATYVAEDVQDTAKLHIGIAPGVPFRVLESRLNLGAVGGGVEDYNITLDSGHHASLDGALVTTAMNAVDRSLDEWSDNKRFFNAGDAILYTYPNTGGPQTWGLEVKYAVLSGEQSNIW